MNAALPAFLLSIFAVPLLNVAGQAADWKPPKTDAAKIANAMNAPW